MGVNVVKLEDIANVDYGTRVVKSKVEGDEYPVYGGGGETFRINKYNRENCVVVSRFAMSPKCTRYVNEKIFLNDSGLTVSTKDNSLLLQEYLNWYLLSKNDEIYSLGRGAGQRNLEIPSFKRMLISYPTDLEEQRKIISQLKLADEIRAKKKLANDKLDEFLKSQFKDMFGTPYINEKSFQSNTFKDVCTVRQGLQIPISERKIEPALNRLKYITIQYLNGKKNTEYIENPRENVICNEQDILMTRTGNTGMVITDVSGVFHNNFFLIDFNRDILKKDFLVAYLKHPKVQDEIIKKAGTSTIPDLNHSDFYKIKLFIPPLELQNNFALIVEHVEAQKQKNELVIEQMNNLFNSLSQRAFKGELAQSGSVDLITKQTVLHAKIIDKCNSHQTFGAVKMEKIFNLCDMSQELNLVPGGYYRKAAGPYVPEMRHSVEEKLAQNNWVKTIKKGNGKKVEFKKDTKFAEYKNLYSEIFKDYEEQINKIIDYFYDKDTDYCEAFSTLYMCWNDLILEGKNPSKFEIIDEFKNHWAPEKQRFERIYLLEILSEMSNNHFEPHGQGLHTIDSEYNVNKDQLNLQLK